MTVSSTYLHTSSACFKSVKVRNWKTADGVGADLGLSASQEYSSELVIVRGGYQYYTDKWQGESAFFDQVYFATGNWKTESSNTKV